MGIFNYFRQLAAPEKVLDDGYAIYTTKFDKEVDESSLNDAVVSGYEEISSVRVNDFEKYLRSLQDTAYSALNNQIDMLSPDELAAISDDCVVSIVIDHSGSMKGSRAQFVCAAVALTSELLARLNCPHEVLGFTTRSWRGGRSRKIWALEGKHNKPGRLCDILHIVYRKRDYKFRHASTIPYQLLNDSVLKENVDGEALLWAAERLHSATSKNKIIIMISDGAPVDDSTMVANDITVLHNHIVHTAKTLNEAEDMLVAGVGIEFSVEKFYPNSISIKRGQNIPEVLFPFVTDLLKSKVSK